MYIFSLEIQYKSSSISNMVSEPLLWPFLSSLVFISATPFFFFFQHCFRHHNHRHSLSPLNLRRHPAVILGFRTYNRRCQGVSHCTDHCRSHHRYKHCSDYGFEATIEIVLHRSTKPWKPQRRQRPHAPPRIAQSFCTVDHALHVPPSSATRLHAPSRSATRRHAPACANFLLLMSALGDVICHVIVDQTVYLRWLWPLTFLQGWLFQSRFFLPSFSRRFHFCSLFLHIVSLNG